MRLRRAPFVWTLAILLPLSVIEACDSRPVVPLDRPDTEGANDGAAPRPTGDGSTPNDGSVTTDGSTSDDGSTGDGSADDDGSVDAGSD